MPAGILVVTGASPKPEGMKVSEATLVAIPLSAMA